MIVQVWCSPKSTEVKIKCENLQIVVIFKSFTARQKAKENEVIWVVLLLLLILSPKLVMLYSYLAKMTWQKSSVRISWIPKLNEIRLISFVPIVWEKGGHQYPASVFSLLSKVCFKVALQHLIKQFGEKKVWQVLRFTFTPFFVMMWKQHSFAFVVALHFSNLNNELQMTFYLTDYYQINCE